MSTPRGGRGAERSRGARGGHTSSSNTNYTRGAGRGRGNGAPAQPTPERPSQAVYTRGSGGPRGGKPVGTGRGTTATTTPRGSMRGRGHHATSQLPPAEYAGGPNSTPFGQEDYTKRLEHIKSMRPKLRERFVREGRMNPEGQMRLSDSVKLIGICTDMCPEYERVRRIVEEDVKPPECAAAQTPETQRLPRRQRKPDESRMVKAYARSAAGMDVELVSEIRSPATCLKTLDYLMKRLDNDDFDFLHSWIWDRTRAIRKDLRTQRIEQRSDITILLTALERSARFLLLSAHQMARSEKEDYSYQQDIEQLNQTLMSLRERYADNRRVGYPSENEAEFYAYRLILDPLFTNTQLENELNRLPSDLRNNPRVQTAVEIYRALKSVIFTKAKSLNQAQANWKRFWDLVKSPSVSYLMACAAEVSFQRVRHVVLDSLWRTFRIGSTSKPQLVETWTTDRVQQVLGFDTANEAVQLCESYGFRFGRSAAGHTFLDVTAKGFVRKPLDLAPDLKPQIFSQGIVEVKRYNRAFSAIVQSMTVQEAKINGLMVDSPQAGMEDQSSLFVPEAPPAKFNAFLQPNGSVGNTPSSTLSTNPFIRHAATAPAPDVAKSNPFLPAKTASTQPFSGAASNMFIPAQTPSNKPFSGLTAGGVQPGLFDATKNHIKFGDSGTTSTTFASPDKPNPFASTPTSTEPTLSTTESNGATPKFSLFSGATSATPQNSAPESTTTPTGSFVFPGFVPGGVKPEVSTSVSSFTPAGSPAPAISAEQDAEKQKAEEDILRRKAEAEAEMQRQRAREEQARLAREQAERQRIEAEHHRQRLQEEERNRIMQAAREQEIRAEQARIARLQARESGYDSLTSDLMFDVEEGLMMQFVENLIVNVAGDVLAAKEEERRRSLQEKQEAMAVAMYEQRILGLKRLVMASWITKVEKKKKARQAKERRKRLREKKAKMAMMEDATSDLPTPTNSEGATDLPNDDFTFRKPQAPASTRRAKRTEERRGTRDPNQNGKLDTKPSSVQTGQETQIHAVLTPLSMGSSHTSNAAYSEAYQKSNAPIDRTATEYFTLRAQGLDPRMLRKRSFDSSSDEDQPEVESKRPKILPTTTNHQPVLPPNRASEYRAGLDAIEQRFRKSGGSPQSATGTVSVNGRTSLNGRSSMLIEQARQLLAKSRSTHASLPNVQHDWGRSVPNLGHRASTSYHSVLGRSMSAAAKKDRAAYWDRSSRFVAKEVYGRGPDAVRAYRNEHGLNPHINTRPSSTDPPAVSSPIPMQQLYKPLNGCTQEQHTEGNDSSGVDIIDIDAEDEDVVSTEEEYEGDEESEEEEQQPPLDRRQFNGGHSYDEGGGSFMDDGNSSIQDYEDAEHVNGYVSGQHIDEVLEHSDGSTEEDSEEALEGDSEEDFEEDLDSDSDEDEEDAREAVATKAAGNTEDDAIELSD